MTQRDYIGFCRKDDATYDVLIEEFLEAEEKLYKTISEFEWLSEKERDKMLDFVKGFYDELSKPERFKRYLHTNCMDRY